MDAALGPFSDCPSPVTYGSFDDLVLFEQGATVRLFALEDGAVWSSALDAAGRPVAWTAEPSLPWFAHDGRWLQAGDRLVHLTETLVVSAAVSVDGALGPWEEGALPGERAQNTGVGTVGDRVYYVTAEDTIFSFPTASLPNPAANGRFELELYDDGEQIRHLLSVCDQLATIDDRNRGAHLQAMWTIDPVDGEVWHRAPRQEEWVSYVDAAARWPYVWVLGLPEDPTDSRIWSTRHP